MLNQSAREGPQERLHLLRMRAVLLFLLLLTACRFCEAQNLVANSNFELNGQAWCHGWYDRCGNHLDYLCAGITDSANCNSANYGSQLYNDAPPAGGQWCLSIVPGQSALPSDLRTFVAGKFLGVYEFKVWARVDHYAFGQIDIISRDSFHYISQHALNFQDTVWTLVTLRDTFKIPADTVLIRITGSESAFEDNKRTYVDLVDFRMIESWTDIQQPKQTTALSFFPDPFSDHLTASLTGNEPATITLYNFLGQQILRETFTYSTTLNTAQLAVGIYFYALGNYKGTLKTGKVIRQ